MWNRCAGSQLWPSEYEPNLSTTNIHRHNTTQIAETLKYDSIRTLIQVLYYVHIGLHCFNSHFPGHPGLACCLLHSQSPVILILSTFTVSVPRFRLSMYGRRAFSAAGPTVWNSLPEDMRDPECSVDSYSHWRHFYFRSTSVFSALEVSYENALYKFTFDIDRPKLLVPTWYSHT